jgi:hypothetical protein
MAEDSWLSMEELHGEKQLLSTPGSTALTSPVPPVGSCGPNESLTPLILSLIR